MFYSVGFDVQDQTFGPLGTLTLGTAGHSSVVLTLSALRSSTRLSVQSSKFFHWQYLLASTLNIKAEDRSAEYRRTDFSNFPFENALTSAANTAIAGAGWPGTLLFTMDMTTGIVSAAYTAASFTMTWSAAFGRQLCGFDADKSGASSYTGIVPFFVVQPTLFAVSEPTPNIEDTGISSHVRVDGGAGFGHSREVVPYRRKFWQRWTLRERVERKYALASHPCTLQDIMEQARRGNPFIIHDGGFAYGVDEAFSPSTEGGPCRPEGSGGDKLNFAAMHVPFDCYVEGAIVFS